MGLLLLAGDTDDDLKLSDHHNSGHLVLAPVVTSVHTGIPQASSISCNELDSDADGFVQFSAQLTVTVMNTIRNKCAITFFMFVIIIGLLIGSIKNKVTDKIVVCLIEYVTCWHLKLKH